VRLLAAAALALQGSSLAGDRAELRVGLDTLYGGDFARAAAYFQRLAEHHPADAAPVVFQAGAYIWWGAALDSADFELQRIDSLLDVALRRARATPGSDFWFATALGYRARQREEHGHAFSAAKDAKAMRDIYRRILAADSSCADCYLGLGVYEYGLARASALARLFARIIGLGGGNAERGIRYMRRSAHDGDLARVEATWVLAAALVREAARDAAGRLVLEREARGYVQQLAARYPGNPVFQKFLASEPIGAAAGPAATAVALAAVGWRECGKLAEHVVDVTLDGVRRDVEPLRDLFVAESRGDQLFDFLFALGEADLAAAVTTRRAGVAVAVRRKLAEGGRRWQIGATRNRANRFHDVIGRRVFHDEAVGPAFDELMHVLLRRNEIHHDRFGARRGRLQLVEKSVAVIVGQGGIEQHDLRLCLPQLLRSRTRAFYGGDHFDVGVRGKQSSESVAHEAVVFDDKNANSRSGWRLLRCGPAIEPAAAIHRLLALRQTIVDSAPSLLGHPTLDAANCPRHTHPRPASNLRAYPRLTAAIMRIS
jgi:hypothetical protein